MTPDLVSLDLVAQRISASGASDERVLAGLIASISDAVRKHCRRHFSLASWDEISRPDGEGLILLREYPVQEVLSLRHSPQVVLEVSNTDTTTNQQARVTVTDTGLTLTRVASGTKSVDTSVLWSSHTTLQGVATQINTLSASGWSARVIGSTTGDYGLWPSVDLYVPPSFGDGLRSQGALDCRGKWAGLTLHVGESAEYDWDPRGWVQVGNTESIWGNPGAWQGMNEPIGLPLGGTYRVQYSAGYATIPPAVQEAAILWISQLWYQVSRDPLLSQTSTSSSSVTGSSGDSTSSSSSKSYRNPAACPPAVKGLLAPWVRRVI